MPKTRYAKTRARHATLNLRDNSPGSGRSKARAYKREYQAHCRVMRTSGLVTDSRGNWVMPKTVGISDAAVRATTAK